MAISGMRSTRDVVRIWFFWKIPAISVFCLIVVGICLYSFTRTPVYESNAKVMLLPKTQDELVVSAGRGNRQYDIQRVSSADINTEVELIRSKEVLNRTLEYFRSAALSEGSAEANAFFTQLIVEPVYSSNMISVSLESHDQDNVAQVLNKLLEVYVKYHKEMYSIEESEAFYDEQKNFYAKRLKEARDALKAYNKANNISNMTGQIDANITMLTQFDGELQKLEIAIAENEAKIAMLEKGIQIQGNDIVLSKEIRSLPVIVELARGLVPLLIKRTEISKTFTKESREYQQIDDQIKMLRQEVKNESLRASKTDTLELETLRTRREALAKQIEILRAKNKDFEAKQQELNSLELDVDIAKQNYLLYGTKTENSRLYAKRNESNLSSVVIAEPGLRPVEAKYPNKLLAFQVAVILGLLAAFILPFLLETLDHKLKTADDVEATLTIPVVCSYREL